MVLAFTPKQALSVSHIVVGFLGILFMAIALALPWATQTFDGISTDGREWDFALSTCGNLQDGEACESFGSATQAVYAVSLVLIVLAWLLTIFLRFKATKSESCGATCGYVTIHLFGLIGVGASMGWWSLLFFAIDSVGGNDVTFSSGLNLAVAGLVFSFVSMFMKCFCGNRDGLEGNKQQTNDAQMNQLESGTQ